MIAINGREVDKLFYRFLQMKKQLSNIIRLLKAPFGGLGACICISASAQFAPVASESGTTAIPKDSSAFVAWATGCTIQRGYMDIAVPDSGYASVGDETSAIGMAGQNGVVSLGDAGIATLTFQNSIYNGAGFDFAVFENGFYTGSPLAFLEFAFVEVSSDGNNFFRFPATSNIQDTIQVPMTGVDCSLVNNLAGKYVFGYGTPFDLEELKNEIGLDVNHITHVRLIDVVGSIAEQFASHDINGNKINDPYPTPFASSGFDLDAVGVIHEVGINGQEELRITNYELRISPNPSSQFSNCRLHVDEKLVDSELRLFDVTGKVLSAQKIKSQYSILNTQYFEKGIYFLSIGAQVSKLIIQ